MKPTKVNGPVFVPEGHTVGEHTTDSCDFLRELRNLASEFVYSTHQSSQRYGTFAMESSHYGSSI